MKRLFTLSALTSAVLAMGGLGLASCNDDLDFAETAKQKPAWQSQDLDPICGYNLMLWNVDTLQLCNIPLNTELPLEVKSKNSRLSYEVDKDESGRPVIRPHLSGVMQTTDQLMSDQLHITVKGHPEMGEKVVNLFVHPAYEPDTRAPKDMSMDERILARAKKALSYGINYGKGLARTVDTEIFDFKNDFGLYARVQDVQDVQGTYTEHTVHSKTDDMVSWELGVNASATFPAKAGWMTISPSFRLKSEHTDRDVDEHVVGTRIERAANVTIQWPDLLEVDTTTNLPKYNAYLKNSFNDALNNPASERYQKYLPQDEHETPLHGIFRLMQTYGSFYPIQVVLGGRGVFTYNRHEHVTEDNFDFEIDLAAEWAKSNKDSLPSGQDGQALMGLVELAKYRSSKNKPSAKGSFHYGRDKKHIVENMTKDITFEYEGGKLNDVNSTLGWTLDRTNPEEWVIVDFKKANTTNPELMIFIDYFITDKQSPRCQLVREAMKMIKFYPNKEQLPDMKNSSTRADNEDDSYVINTTPFYYYLDSIEGLLNSKKPGLVLADVTVVSSDGRDDPWKPIEMMGPDEKLRTYYPLRANYFSPVRSDINYAVHLDDDVFLKDLFRYTNPFQLLFIEPKTKKDLVYYALDYDDECTGVVDIQFFEPGKEPRDYWTNPKGDYTNAGCRDTGSPSQKLYIKRGDKDTKYEDKIKAVGLYSFDGEQSGHVFASSPLWYELPKNCSQSERDEFDQKWKEQIDVNHNITNDEGHRVGWAVRQNCHWKMVWSREPLRTIRSYYKMDEEWDSADYFQKVLPRRRGE